MLVEVMTAAEAVETSVTSTNINSLSQDYTNLDDHFSQTNNQRRLLIFILTLIQYLLIIYF